MGCIVFIVVCCFVIKNVRIGWICVKSIIVDVIVSKNFI